jgi:hypothetical protein
MKWRKTEAVEVRNLVQRDPLLQNTFQSILIAVIERLTAM